MRAAELARERWWPGSWCSCRPAALQKPCYRDPTDGSDVDGCFYIRRTSCPRRESAERRMQSAPSTSGCFILSRVAYVSAIFCLRAQQSRAAVQRRCIAAKAVARTALQQYRGNDDSNHSNLTHPTHPMHAWGELYLGCQLCSHDVAGLDQHDQDTSRATGCAAKVWG